MIDAPFLQHEFMRNALLAGLFAGVSCSIIGVFVVTMHLAFLGVSIAHAALAGALLGVWLGFSPLAGAIIFSLAAAGVVGPLADRTELSPDTSVGIVFSFVLGLGFIFLGLTEGARTQALQVLMGGILSVSRAELLVSAGLAAGVVLLVTLFFKEIQAVVCHRDVAVAVGLPATLVFYGILFAAGSVIAVSLGAVGGILIYCLIINPAAAAFQLTYSLRRMMLYASGFGVASCWLGLGASYLWGLPAGGSIVVVSAMLFALAAVFSPKRKAPSWKRRPIA